MKKGRSPRGHFVAKGRIGVVDLSGRLYDGIVAEYRAQPRDEEEARNAEAKKKVSDAETLEKATQAQKPKITTQLDLFKVEATPETLPAVRKRLSDLGQVIPPPEQLTPEAFATYHKAEIDKWWPLVRAAGIKVE